MDRKWHIWTWGIFNSDTELKLSTEIKLNIKLGVWVKHPNFSSQESGMDNKLNIQTWGTYNSDTEIKLRKVIKTN